MNRLDVFTLKFGDADWMDICFPTLKSWCQRHKYPLHVFGDDFPEYPSPKFCEINMLEKFLSGTSTHMLYVDADVLIHSKAPAIPLTEGFSATSDGPHKEWNARWREWHKEHYKTTPKDGFDYFNAGVWLCDRASAKKILEQAKPPFIVESQEQHEMNGWVYRALGSYTQLHPSWNRYGEDLEPSWFFHVWGENKMQALRSIESSGFLDPDMTPNDALIYNVRPSTFPNSDKVVVTQFVQDAGLGNTLFEWAAGLGLARRLGLPFRWVWRDSSLRQFELGHFGIGAPKFRQYPIVAQKLGQGNLEMVEISLKRINESKDAFCGVCLPWQDEKCFENVADEIRERFRLDPITLNVSEGHTPVAVQVRRGDYVGHSRLDVTNITYFLKAMKFIRSKVDKPHFFIISDDPAWCEKQFQREIDATVMPAQTSIEGLRTMVSCKAHIISNSTFGWWGAWLGESGPVVVPDPWHRNPGSYGKWEPRPERWHRIAVSTHAIEPFVELPPPAVKRAIVYPYKLENARWQELRYSMRSIETFFEDKECPIFIFGTHKPGWLRNHPRVKFFDSWSYSDALTRGCQSAEEVMWMNDDIVLLKPTTWEDIKVPRYLRPVRSDFTSQMKVQGNPWQAGVIRVLSDLKLEGYEDLKIYSTHTPYFYERTKVLEIFRRYGCFEKMPLELALFNVFGENSRPLGDLKTQTHPFGDAQFLNYDDRRLTPGIKQGLKEMFPAFAAWELPVYFEA